MSKLFISGIPGAGKTCLGKYFASTLSYEHIELEGGPYHFDSIEQIGAAAKEFASKQNNIVITWGFPCHEPFFEFIDKLKAGGFKVIWFDGNREAAFKLFNDRAKGNVGLDIEGYRKAFRDQVKAIDDSKAIQRIMPDKIIDTFNSSGDHKEFVEIAEEIFKIV